MDGIIYVSEFLSDPGQVFAELQTTIVWNDSMALRKTASYGVAYNYSQMSYPFKPFTSLLDQLSISLAAQIGFLANNCLINYYANGNSRMGFHSDQTDILATGTGVAILSLGALRTLRFREIIDKTNIVDFALPAGSLLYMDQGVQAKWEHAIPKADIDMPRISLTFRSIAG
ncbi:alpha-ketoglutarate-dependent dioxygenase AlkB [Mucilaginibacter sp.]|uniref:alpha-ketoglutarate-dependent dioxygenase AlkB n=1 Tax=Mucilaginibacter sp. TaxID=1882438 RepID=UPI003267E713